MVSALQRLGWPYTERRALAGNLDKGDISGTPGICWEVKDAKTWQIPAWMRETEVERVNSKSDFGILVIKVPGVGHKNAEKWLSVMDDDDAFNLYSAVKMTHGDGPRFQVVQMKAVSGRAAVAGLKERERACGDTPVLVQVRKTMSKYVTKPGFWNLMRLEARCKLLVDAGYGGHAIMDTITSRNVKEHGHE